VLTTVQVSSKRQARLTRCAVVQPVLAATRLPGAPTEPLPTGLHLVAAPAGAVNTTAQAAAARVSWAAVADIAAAPARRLAR